MLILGIDDAGRGPLIGNMFLAGVLVKEEDQNYLKHEGVKDSKQVKHQERIRLSGFIKDLCLGYHVVSSSPEQIDHSLNSGVNLNTLEAIKTAEIINALAKGRDDKIKVIVDCPSPNTAAWKAVLLTFLDNKNIDISCEHKADVNHPAVSAASILAKCAREDSIAEIHQKFGDFGSGYMSDPVTQEFLSKYGSELQDSGLFRKTWATWQNHLASREQKKLGDF